MVSFTGDSVSLNSNDLFRLSYRSDPDYELFFVLVGLLEFKFAKIERTLDHVKHAAGVY